MMRFSNVFVRRFTTLYATILFGLSLIFVLLIFASGHRIDFKDVAQLKLWVETVFFLLTGLSLIPPFQHSAKSFYSITFLGLTQLSFIDLGLEFYSVERDSATVFLLLFLFVLSVMNTGLIFFEWKCKSS
jgi:hypothetical protein